MTPAHRRNVVLVILATHLVLALLTATFVYVGWQHLDHNIRSGGEIEHKVHKLQADAPRQPLNILVLGVDTRDCPGCHVDNEQGEDGSDTTILVHVAADRTSAYAISIPRDALVKPVDCTADHHYLGTDVVQWNAAFAAGGPDCTAAQIEKNFGVYVDDYITVNFGGFKDMVAALGGVDVCIPKPLDDDVKMHVHFDAGTSVHLDGASALNYMRLRHVGDGTDIGRIKRQQSFIAALINKADSDGTLSRPDKLYKFANALTKSITTNPEIASAGALVKLAESLRSTDPAHIKFVTLPSQVYDVPRDDPYWGRVQVLPAAYGLMKAVSNDGSIAAFAKGAINAGGATKHPTQEQKAAADAAGICA